LVEGSTRDSACNLVDINVITNTEVTRLVCRSVNDNTAVSLCSKVTLDLAPTQKAFKHLNNTKLSGSYPVKFFKLSVESNANQIEVNIGQDSRDKNLFWVYSDENLINELELGYIRSKYISSKTEDCI